jgi:hypothetical protein
MKPTKIYLSDGVFVDWDGNNLVLTTEDGIRTTNRIVLERDTYTALVQYVEHLNTEPERES